MYNGAGRIANAVDDNVPKSFARSFIDTSCVDKIPFGNRLYLPSSEAGALSSPPNLLSSPRILFFVLGEELISLSL